MVNTPMDPEERHRIEVRISEINRDLGLLEPAPLGAESSVPQHDLAEVEELYAERERLLQELEKDC
jgi:hypothetical protein